MQRTKVGRNDPCPCGSGRKYKQCCLAADEQARAEEARRWAEEEGEDELDLSLEENLTPAQRAAFKQVNARFLLEADALRQTLDRLSKDKELRRPLMDADVMDRRAVALFEEERFAPLRFTPEDLARAHGVEEFVPEDPPEPPTTERDLADLKRRLFRPRRRRLLARALMLHMLDLDREGRPADALIVGVMAIDLERRIPASNVFLVTMLNAGLEEWFRLDKEKRDRQLRAAGLDPEELGRLSVEEREARFDSLCADPEVQRVFRLSRGEGAAADEAQGRMQGWADQWPDTLELPAGREALFTSSELAPWSADYLNALRAALIPANGSDPESEDDDLETVTVDLLLAAVRTLVRDEERPSLVARWEAARQRLLEAGEVEAARSAQVAILELKLSDNLEGCPVVQQAMWASFCRLARDAGLDP